MKANNSEFARQQNCRASDRLRAFPLGSEESGLKAIIHPTDSAMVLGLSHWPACIP